MLTDLFEIILNYYQYFALILQTEGVEFPTAWSTTGSRVSLANLDFNFFRQYADFVPEDLDFRLYFILVCVIIPLALSFAGLLMLNSHIVVVWYFIALTGTVMLSAGLTGTLLESSSDFALDSATATAMVTLGATMLIFCCVTLLIRKTAGCCEEEATVSETKGMTVRQIIDSQTRQCNLTGSIENLGIVLCLAILGCIFAGFMSSTALSTHRIGVTRRSFAGFTYVLGLILISIAATVFLWSFIGWFESGRRLQWHFITFVQVNFMKMLLIFTSVVYMPVGSGVFLMFNCNIFSCPDASRLVDFGSYVTVNSSLGDACSNCLVADEQRCPDSLQHSICASSSDARLEFDLGIPCSNMRTFYWPAAALVTVSFIAGVPMLFYRIIKVSADLVTSTIPVDSGLAGEEEIWAAKVLSTNNVAKFLYQPFEHRFRYMRLLQILQKFVIVFTATYIFRAGFSSANIALNAALGIHTTAFALLFALSPYILPFEDRVSYLVSFQLVMAAGTAVMILYQVDVPLWWTTGVVVINAAIPLLALIAGALLAYFSTKQEAAARQRSDDRAVKRRINAIARVFASGKLTSSVYPAMPVYASMGRRSSDGSLATAVDVDAPSGQVPALQLHRLSVSTSQSEGLTSNVSPRSAVIATSVSIAQSPKAGNRPSAVAPRLPLSSATAEATQDGVSAFPPHCGTGNGKKKKIVIKKIVKKAKPKNEDSHKTESPRVSTTSNALERRGSARDTVNNVVKKAMESADDEVTDTSTESSVDFDMSDDDNEHNVRTVPTLAVRPASQRGEKPLDAMNLTFTKKPSVPLLDRSELLRSSSSVTTDAAGNGIDGPTTSGNSSPRGHVAAAFSHSGSLVNSSTRIPPAPGVVPGTPLEASRRDSGGIQQREGTASGSFRANGEGKLSIAERKAQFSLSGEGAGITRKNSATADLSGSFSSRRRPPEIATESGSGLLRPTTSQALGAKDVRNISPRNPLAASRQGSRTPATTSASGAHRVPQGLADCENEFGSTLGKLNSSSSPTVEWNSSSPAAGDEGAGELAVEDDDDDNGDMDIAVLLQRANAGELTLNQRQHLAATMKTRERFDKLFFEMLNRKKLLGITGEAAKQALVPLARDELELQQRFLDDLVADADHGINAAVRKTLNWYLIFSGMLTFIALGFCLLGLLVQQDPGARQVSGSNTDPARHFAGHATFRNFTEHCCCLPFEYPPPRREAKVEKWVCEDGAVVERLRAWRVVDAGGNEVEVVDGTARIRPLCGIDFVNPTACALKYTEAASGIAVVSLECPSDSLISATERVLW